MLASQRSLTSASNACIPGPYLELFGRNTRADKLAVIADAGDAAGSHNPIAIRGHGVIGRRWAERGPTLKLVGPELLPHQATERGRPNPDNWERSDAMRKRVLTVRGDSAKAELSAPVANLYKI
jgi:hypothetical protein